MKKVTRRYKTTYNGYEISVRDYGYKSQPPVGVMISGKRLGECTNLYGEPCYFYKSFNAYTMREGIELAIKTVKNRL